MDFLLYHLALIVKKVRVKTLVRSLFGRSDNKETSTHKDDLDLILRSRAPISGLPEIGDFDAQVG